MKEARTPWLRRPRRRYIPQYIACTLFVCVGLSRAPPMWGRPKKKVVASMTIAHALRTTTNTYTCISPFLQNIGRLSELFVPP